MIVLDASAALSGLCNEGSARELLANEQSHVPHLIDSEVVNGLRRIIASGEMTSDDGWQILGTWELLGLVRHPTHGLLDRIWELRDHLSAYDASYVALAEGLGCPLVTANARLSRAPGLRCPVTVVPR